MCFRKSLSLHQRFIPPHSQKQQFIVSLSFIKRELASDSVADGMQNSLCHPLTLTVFRVPPPNPNDKVFGLVLWEPPTNPPPQNSLMICRGTTKLA